MKLLSQQVTVYRSDGSRRVLTDCHFELKEEVTQDALGHHLHRRFILIARGNPDLKPGDRVQEGIGPGEIDWQIYIPEQVPGLVTVGYVKPFYWGSRISHTEAGGVYDRY